jgi:hypothetical protein
MPLVAWLHHSRCGARHSPAGRAAGQRLRPSFLQKPAFAWFAIALPANLIAQFSKVKGPITAKLIFSAQTVWLFQHRIFIVKT